MKLRNANGGFISPASRRRRGPGHCIRAAKGETVGVPRVKELQQRARKVNSKTRGFSSRAASSSASRELLHIAWQNCRAERDLIHGAIMGGLLCGGSEIFIKQQPG